MSTHKLPAGLPFNWAICSCCGGHGQVENPAFSNGFTSDEWSEWDRDDQQFYLRGGYDVACSECGGSGKVREPAVERMTYAQKRQVAALRREDRIAAEDARLFRAECAAERRMGC